MMYMLLSLSTTLSFTFLFLEHPLTLGLILFIQSICMCMISGLMFKSFWFSYIMLLIYLGGILILFMYVTSLIPNQLFSYSTPTFLLIIFFPIDLTLLIIENLEFHTSLYENMENSSFLNIPTSYFLLKMYNKPINMITILIATYLFLTLIAVVKIVNIHKGPLRKSK
uniref:NADH-ubiquinone oxidoreductase chain 6 n=2 Tax=unclassified Phyllothelys TaxID=2628741 RepID=A0A343UMN0_9NEOP|nr:NADH dehydrogenase subunit 6 [Phyllothelys sp. 1 JZ-2017]AVE15657.1 NADH dehydrogenase subunit 6 [Phyllothelys sp. 2 JZ-2017]